MSVNRSLLEVDTRVFAPHHWANCCTPQHNKKARDFWKASSFFHSIRIKRAVLKTVQLRTSSYNSNPNYRVLFWLEFAFEVAFELRKCDEF